MAILEKIRSRSLFLILVIGLALFAFVISGIFSKNSGTGKSTVGEVNGEPILRQDFAYKVENMSRRYGANATTVQVVNQVWNQEVRGIVLGQQYEDLGINIEKDQILEVVKANPAFASDPTFQNEAGVFDEGKFIEFIANLKANNPAGYQQWKMQEDALINASKEQSYFNLIKAGVGSTLKEGELAYHLETDKVDVKYVKIPYTSIPDSTVNVSDSEIESYVKKHENEFKQESSRDVRYVYFEEKASDDDVKEIENDLSKLLKNSIVYNEATKADDTVAGFKTTTDLRDFVNRNSDIKFDTTYVTKAQLPAAFADTLYNLPVGGVFGPYKDGNFYKLSRMVHKKEGGSVKASHILISYDGAGAQPKESRTKEEAKAKADEILAKVKANPDDFAALARDNSEDPGSASKGGTYDNIPEGQMVPAFNDYIFDNPIGSIGVVETQFGYHVIKIDDKYDVVQIATIAREIEPSENTINDLFTATTKFQMAAVSGDFQEEAKSSNYTVRPVNQVKALDENIPGIGNQRGIVQWAFNADTEVGDVKRFNTPNGYAVIQLTGKRKEGLATAKDASARVLPILRKQKKAAMIMEQNAGKSIDELAKSNNVNVSGATGLTMKTPTISGAGREPKVVGVAMGLSEGENSSLIEGENGVFMVSVTKKEIAPSLDNYATYANSQKTLNRNRANFAAYNALKDAADIEDERADIY
ncbi:peptidylprolyl isomerase [Galbibacter pacificus]|uniref:Periplasmic chaperone PpiD n=1 Tax=Galbibacter pacificus TaxID=2996052 RepID=A0ABT6FW57_9FLAO|nr:peptidylprolyl isomerase [Galbibacter pacificus]MDG3584058.1 peptidylprolyl isomerase [Galbibacter pacificus]MDG3587506.1 peptidylprolyl isomerase [Galbibacter pacificus]